jgi:hypothetical protein
MPPELIAIVGTLSGGLLVGLINYFSNKRIKNHEWRLALARDQVTARQKLFADFLVEAQRLVMLAREEKLSSLTDFNIINGKFAEICLVSSEHVIEEAKKLADYAITSHAAQPAKEVANLFALKQSFIAAARQDMAKVLGEA